MTNVLLNRRYSVNAKSVRRSHSNFEVPDFDLEILTSKKRKEANRDRRQNGTKSREHPQRLFLQVSLSKNVFTFRPIVQSGLIKLY